MSPTGIAAKQPRTSVLALCNAVSIVIRLSERPRQILNYNQEHTHEHIPFILLFHERSFGCGFPTHTHTHAQRKLQKQRRKMKMKRRAGKHTHIRTHTYTPKQSGFVCVVCSFLKISHTHTHTHTHTSYTHTHTHHIHTSHTHTSHIYHITRIKNNSKEDAHTTGACAWKHTHIHY